MCAIRVILSRSFFLEVTMVEEGDAGGSGEEVVFYKLKREQI